MNQEDKPDKSIKSNNSDDTDNGFSDIIYSYTREEAVEDGVLVDVSEIAKEVGIIYPTAATQSVHSKYVLFPDELKGLQDESGRLWDILTMLFYAIKRDQKNLAQLSFNVIVALPDKGNWENNEQRIPDMPEHRNVNLKALCHANDDRSPCITIMLPHEN